MTPRLAWASFGLLLLVPLGASAPTPVVHDVLYFHADGTMDATAGGASGQAQSGAFRSAPAAAPFVLKPGATVFLPSTVLLSHATVVQLLANGTLVGSGRAAASLLHLGGGTRAIALENQELRVPAGTILVVTIAGGSGMISAGGGSNAPRLEFDRSAIAAPAPPAVPTTTQSTPAAPIVGPPAPTTSGTNAGSGSTSEIPLESASQDPDAASGSAANSDGATGAQGASTSGRTGIGPAVAALVFLAVAALAGLGLARVGRA